MKEERFCLFSRRVSSPLVIPPFPRVREEVEYPGKPFSAGFHAPEPGVGPILPRVSAGAGPGGRSFRPHFGRKFEGKSVSLASGNALINGKCGVRPDVPRNQPQR